MKMLSSMLLLATKWHDGQFDKAGRPYILHPLKVMYLLKSDDEELMCIAVGHDLFEDTGCTFTEMREVGMSPRVLNGIMALTKMPGQTFEEYKEKVKSNIDAVRVKMCDLRHNSDLRRLRGVTEKDMKRVVKYTAFYDELKKVEELAGRLEPVEI